MPNPLALWPVLGSTTANKVRLSDGTTTQDVTVSMTANEYLWPSGDGDAASGERDLSLVVLNGLNTNTLGIVWTRAWNASIHRVTYTSSIAARLLWSVSGSDRFDPALLGFTSVDTALGTTHAAPNQPDGLWAPARPWLFDTRKEPRHLGALARSISGVTRGYSLARVSERTVRWMRLPRPKVLTEYAAATEPRSTLQRLYEQAAEKRLRIYDDEADQSAGSSKYQSLVFRDLSRPWSLREGEAGVRYDATLALAEYVT